MNIGDAVQNGGRRYPYRFHDIHTTRDVSNFRKCGTGIIFHVEQSTPIRNPTPSYLPTCPLLPVRTPS